MRIDRWLIPTLRKYLECACAELADSMGGPVARVSLMHSDQPVPDGCDCGCDLARAGLECTCPPEARGGRLYARVGLARPVNSPLEALPLCLPKDYLMTVYVGLFRCVPSCRAEGMDDAEEDHMAMVGINDLLALRRAARCCVQGLPRTVQLSDLGWNPIGPAGCCFGGELMLGVVVP